MSITVNVQSEWDAVPNILPRFKNSVYEHQHGREDNISIIPCTPPISAEEALIHMRKQNLSYYMSAIEPVIIRRGVSRLFAHLFGYTNILNSLEDERNELFAIAHCQLDPNNEVHNRMLQTVYKGLTGVHIDCPRYGSHWEQIGFQSGKPGSDLRGVGLLGLIHLVNLASSPRLAPLARALYYASQDPYVGYPLAVLSLNLTKSTLQALREGVLNRECNDSKSVTKVVLLYHAALLSATIRLWQARQCTIKDCGHVIKQAETQCKRKVHFAIESLQEHIRRLSLPERCSPRARFVQAGNLHQLASQAQKEFFI